MALLQQGVTGDQGCLRVTTGLSACRAQVQLPHYPLSTGPLHLLPCSASQGSPSPVFPGGGTGRCFCGSQTTRQGGLGGARLQRVRTDPRPWDVKAWPGLTEVRSRAGPTGCPSHPSHHLRVRGAGNVPAGGAWLEAGQAA